MNKIIKCLFISFTINTTFANELECTLYNDTGEVYLTYPYDLPNHTERLKKYIGKETWSTPYLAREACAQFQTHYEFNKELVEVDHFCDPYEVVEYKVFGLLLTNRGTKEKVYLLSTGEHREPFFINIGFTTRCDQR
jgi:hypothetical protein